MNISAQLPTIKIKNSTLFGQFPPHPRHPHVYNQRLDFLHYEICSTLYGRHDYLSAIYGLKSF